METYLTEIKQLRIPRPKFEPNSCHQQHQQATATTVTPPPHHQAHHPHHAHHQWRHFVRPFTPPRDYHLPVVGGDSATHDTM
ncbi:hypothetical protein AWZ03_013219 [Drosophila navojoa]|uniref:Uncharacterized protein, isoform A n=3 Tax=mojavensis species complex TaxID=198037 RepID=B4KYV8_DROMO|nr:uncharacterized protein LOC6582682 [Drosophila mojavensis]XP_017872749.1 PREDICTED: uncharacterized protein LOC108620356 [Drosophila arizonae]XP_017966366.1 uncharacterized protein LOC108658223 [Drosophila navojoa]XP_032586821.1 uncharacterized protein LOC6582682 [Drosophila mojavensis]EDW18850.1 uncharacterized protein Dmoj_GI11851, isoform A [Drosophila mojavensis]TDG40361.1 hypothetical protein AWZ03_013219 [Drosophila navojoa]